MNKFKKICTAIVLCTFVFGATAFDVKANTTSDVVEIESMDVSLININKAVVGFDVDDLGTADLPKYRISIPKELKGKVKIKKKFKKGRLGLSGGRLVSPNFIVKVNSKFYKSNNIANGSEIYIFVKSKGISKTYSLDLNDVFFRVSLT